MHLDVHLDEGILRLNNFWLWTGFKFKKEFSSFILGLQQTHTFPAFNLRVYMRSNKHEFFYIQVIGIRPGDLIRVYKYD